MRFTLVLAIALITSAATLNFSVVPEDVLQAHLKLAAPKNAERYRRLKDLFAQSGCGDGVLQEQPVKGTKEPNMICETTATESPRRIIVGAHFDAVGGDGVIDNWSGAVLLPTYYEFTRNRAHRHTFDFVAFTGEEKGLLGSRAYVKSIPKEERKQIAAVIIMDSLGLTPTKCWIHGSSQELVVAAASIARALNLDFQGVEVEKVGTTDSQPFKDAQIPVLCLHSVTQQTWQVINGSKDVWSAVSWKDYYDSHRLISALLNYFDETLP